MIGCVSGEKLGIIINNVHYIGQLAACLAATV